jgi:hypothetical protein
MPRVGFEPTTQVFERPLRSGYSLDAMLKCFFLQYPLTGAKEVSVLPPSLLPKRYQGLSSPGYNGRNVKLTTHLQTSVEIKKTWVYTSTFPYFFMA